MLITAVVKDENSRIISWRERDYAYSLTRDDSGRPLFLRGTSAGGVGVAVEFNYRQDGSFSSMVGATSTVLISEILADAAGLSTAAGGSGAGLTAPVAKASLAADVQTSLGKADTALQAAEKGAANGVASLGGDGKLIVGQLPDLAITQFLGSVANQTAMLALTGQRGDWCIRSDDGKVYVLNADAPATVGSWTALSYPASVQVINDLTTGGASAALSAEQGKTLQANKAPRAGSGGTLGATKTTTDADDAKVFTASSACTITVHSGAVEGFGLGVSGAGSVTFAGASGVTVTDKRATGSTNPTAALVYLAANTFEVWGAKA